MGWSVHGLGSPSCESMVPMPYVDVSVARKKAFE